MKKTDMFVGLEVALIPRQGMRPILARVTKIASQGRDHEVKVKGHTLWQPGHEVHLRKGYNLVCPMCRWEKGERYVVKSNWLQPWSEVSHAYIRRCQLCQEGPVTFDHLVECVNNKEIYQLLDYDVEEYWRERYLEIAEYAQKLLALAGFEVSANSWSFGVWAGTREFRIRDGWKDRQVVKFYQEVLIPTLEKRFGVSDNIRYERHPEPDRRDSEIRGEGESRI